MTRSIDADALKKTFHDEWDEVLVWDESGSATADEFCMIVDDAPTVDSVKHGHWLRLDYCTFHCKLCGTTFMLMQGESNMNYCPNCGAKMDEVIE